MKMREALVKIRDKCVIYNNDLAEEIDALCANALSAPPRNCDVGTADEQSERFDKFCDEQCMKSCKACPVYKAMITDCECFSRWAQMPYEAKEGDKHE